MKGKCLNDFIKELYINPEMEFVYNNEHYMLSGYVDIDLYTLELWNITKNKFIFTISDKSREKCVNLFKNSPIFDKKTIFEAESEIEVLYG